ncbi:MAG: hypothetical protein ACREYE_11105 [Gammaproteobacteria bacterium]
MITALFLSALLLSVTSTIHFEALTFLSSITNRFVHLPRLTVLVAMLLLPVAHLLEITLYALALLLPHG